MARHSIFRVLATVGFFFAVLHDGQAWERKDMNPSKLPRPGEPKPEEMEVSCGAADCTALKIYYYKGKHFASGRKNILYIPGGPGIIADPNSKALALPQLLEDANNVYYLYVRGTGPSLVPTDKDNDKLLRARYVADDIEALRRKELGENSWDAIYAHSWGAIVAQLYAKNYGKVAKVILSGSVSRHKDYEPNRIEMLERNLKKIYENNSSTVCSLTNLKNNAVDDFCFLSEDQRSTTRKQLTKMLGEFDSSYGSVYFVTQYFKELKRDKAFFEKFPYPDTFFLALNGLGNFGAKETTNMASNEAQIDSALIVGYYLSLKKEDLPASDKRACEVAPFFNGIKGAGRELVIKPYCEHIEKAKENSGDGVSMSIRAQEVFGLFDGLDRWLFAKLNQAKLLDKNQCFSMDAIKRFAKNPDVRSVAREVVEKIGTTTAPDEGPVCPWDPGKFKHNVPTLILKGGADATTAGCQAEDFFNFGLGGQRVLFTFPGQGHLTTPPTVGNVSNLTVPSPAVLDPKIPIAVRNYVELINLFLKNSRAKDFINDENTQKLKTSFGATIQLGDGPKDQAKCPINRRIDD